MYENKNEFSFNETILITINIINLPVIEVSFIVVQF